MNIFDGAHGFEFHDNQPFYHKVKAVLAYQSTSIMHRKLFLAFVADMPVLQFDAKRFFVSGFKVSGAKTTMHFNRRADDLPC